LAGLVLSRILGKRLPALPLKHRNIDLTIVQRLHVPSYQKESGTWDLTILYWRQSQNRQIVEEELAFPSGTATAQVISVLHGMPSTGSGLRSRHGYSPLDQQDEETSPSPDIAGDSQDPGSQTSEFTQNHAWFSLLWSFLVSSMLTVFTSNSSSNTEAHTFTQLMAYFFPVIFALPLFGDYLARNWLWTFTPSLSYIGQGDSSS
jgi:uncharacterized oligopeptide transporter (OPT) family protein